MTCARELRAHSLWGPCTRLWLAWNTSLASTHSSDSPSCNNKLAGGEPTQGRDRKPLVGATDEAEKELQNNQSAERKDSKSVSSGQLCLADHPPCCVCVCVFVGNLAGLCFLTVCWSRLESEGFSSPMTRKAAMVRSSFRGKSSRIRTSSTPEQKRRRHRTNKTKQNKARESVQVKRGEEEKRRAMQTQTQRDCAKQTD